MNHNSMIIMKHFIELMADRSFPLMEMWLKVSFVNCVDLHISCKEPSWMYLEESSLICPHPGYVKIFNGSQEIHFVDGWQETSFIKEKALELERSVEARHSMSKEAKLLIRLWFEKYPKINGQRVLDYKLGDFNWPKRAYIEGDEIITAITENGQHHHIDIIKFREIYNENKQT